MAGNIRLGLRSRDALEHDMCPNLHTLREEAKAIFGDMKSRNRRMRKNGCSVFLNLALNQWSGELSKRIDSD